MAIVFTVNEKTQAPNVPIKWKFVDRDTIFFSLPANFENNVIVRSHYFKIPENSEVQVLNGKVSGCIFVNLSKPKNYSFINDNTVTTTTIQPSEPISVVSDDLPTEEQSLSCITTTTVSRIPSKRKKDR